MEKYFIPLAPFLFMTAGLSLCVYIFCSLKREIHRLQTRLKQRDTEQDAAAQTLLVQIEEMRAELRDAEERTAQLVPPSPPRSGLNLNVRTQVLRMSRHGEAEEQIASKLRLPRNEVALLLKVHKLAADGPPIESFTS
jgi:hypothetical protein